MARNKSKPTTPVQAPKSSSSSSREVSPARNVSYFQKIKNYKVNKSAVWDIVMMILINLLFIVFFINICIIGSILYRKFKKPNYGEECNKGALDTEVVTELMNKCYEYELVRDKYVKARSFIDEIVSSTILFIILLVLIIFHRE